MIVGSMQNVNKMAVQPTLLAVFHVGGTDIDLVNKVKYLGLHIDNSLTWKCPTENIKGKVSRAIGLLKSILIFYEANFVARKTRAPLNQSSRNFPDFFVFTVPNAIEISISQIPPKSGVMGKAAKSKDRWTPLTNGVTPCD